MAKASMIVKENNVETHVNDQQNKRDLTMGMLLELQQSAKAQELAKNYEFHYLKEEAEVKVSESWEKTNQKAATSFVSSLFNMFGGCQVKEEKNKEVTK